MLLEIGQAHTGLEIMYICLFRDMVGATERTFEDQGLVDCFTTGRLTDDLKCLRIGPVNSVSSWVRSISGTHYQKIAHVYCIVAADVSNRRPELD
jgi:hypothetical protein